MIRVCADLSAQDASRKMAACPAGAKKLSPWAERVRDFRNEGFYERFCRQGANRTRRPHPPRTGPRAAIQPRSGERKAA